MAWCSRNVVGIFKPAPYRTFQRGGEYGYTAKNKCFTWFTDIHIGTQYGIQYEYTEPYYIEGEAGWWQIVWSPAYT